MKLRVLLLLVSALWSLASAAERPTNVVFILADDLGWGELGCYGQQKIRTPHIDKLAADGTRFTQHYSGAPVCAPSRCVLMTGRHLGHAEIRGNRQAKRSFPRFTEGQHPIPGHAKQTKGKVILSDWIGETYASHPILDQALGFIRSNKDRPFFLYLPFTEPHVAMHPPVESVNQYPEEWDDRVYRGQCGYLPHPRPRAGYAAMISDLDRHVGAVMAELEKTAVLDQTLVVFTSDNGTTHRSRDERFGIGGVDADFFNSTNGLREFKGSVHEGGIRVPMIVRYPAAVKKGASNDTPGYFADWYPTLCAAAGLEPPANLDGDNLWPAITGVND